VQPPLNPQVVLPAVRRRNVDQLAVAKLLELDVQPPDRADVTDKPALLEAPGPLRLGRRRVLAAVVDQPPDTEQVPPERLAAELPLRHPLRTRRRREDFGVPGVELPAARRPRRVHEPDPWLIGMRTAAAGVRSLAPLDARRAPRPAGLLAAPGGGRQPAGSVASREPVELAHEPPKRP